MPFLHQCAQYDLSHKLYTLFNANSWYYASLYISPDILHHLYEKYKKKVYNILLLNSQNRLPLKNEQELCHFLPVTRAIGFFVVSIKIFLISIETI